MPTSWTTADETRAVQSTDHPIRSPSGKSLAGHVAYEGCSGVVHSLAKWVWARVHRCMDGHAGQDYCWTKEESLFLFGSPISRFTCWFLGDFLQMENPSRPK